MTYKKYMKNAITHTISTITFVHANMTYRIIYNGPIHSADTIINAHYPDCHDKVGATIMTDYLLTEGNYQIIEVSTGRIIEEVGTVIQYQFDLLLSRNKAT